MTIYTGVLGGPYSLLGNMVLGAGTQSIQDISGLTSDDLENQATILTYQGEEWISRRLAGEPVSSDVYIGWGVGEGEISKEDTELFEEETDVVRVKAQLKAMEFWPKAADLPENAGMTYMYVATANFTVLDDITITEAGLFDALTDGTLLIHTTFDGITAGGVIDSYDPGDQIEFNFTLDPS